MTNTTATMCFGCGQDNPIGLKLEFEETGSTYRTYFTAGEEHQGFDGIMHGGIICTLLDEIMGRYLFGKGIIAPTAELKVRFKNPARIKEQMIIEGEITNEKRRTIEMKAVAKYEDGTIIAEAKGKFVKKGNK